MMNRDILHTRLIAPIVALLTQGITPEKIAWSMAIGVVVGVFPVLGTTTILCAAAALIFQLNMPAIQLVNYLIYPLQLIFLLPFVRLGEKLFRAAPQSLSLPQMLALARSNPPQAAAALWLVTIHAVAAWLLLGAPAIFLLYFVLKHMLRQLAITYGQRNKAARLQ